jgi:drug/metabolite transporter (DMT)-like permease
LAAFLLLGVTGWIGHSFVLKAMGLEQASALVPLNYTQLIAVSVLGYLFFAQIPDLWTLTGAAIIAGSGILCASARQA